MHKSTLDLPEHVGAIEDGGGRRQEVRELETEGAGKAGLSPVDYMTE
jgi:hypothetical protein